MLLKLDRTYKRLEWPYQYSKISDNIERAVYLHETDKVRMKKLNERELHCLEGHECDLKNVPFKDANGKEITKFKCKVC
jgi:hypothetical protein